MRFLCLFLVLCGGFAEAIEQPKKSSIGPPKMICIQEKTAPSDQPVPERISVREDRKRLFKFSAAAQPPRSAQVHPAATSVVND